MKKDYRLQGTRYASREVGVFCLDFTLDYSYVAGAAQRLLYARHRRHPTLLQFEEPLEDAFAIGYDGLTIPATRVVLNIDERMRLFYTTRDVGCDIETIRFHFEELMAPWLLDMPSFTICKSEDFHDFARLERGYYNPRTRYALDHGVRMYDSPLASVVSAIVPPSPAQSN